jgi:hypothetical protein
MRKLMALILVILVSPGMSLAQALSGAPTPAVPQHKTRRKKAAISAPKFAPINVNEQSYEYYDADAGWTDATAVSYSYKGSSLEEPKDFERVITPLNDPLADDLLRSAADKDGWGQGLLWGGIAVDTAGWTDFAIEMAGLGTTADSSGHITDHEPNMAPSVLMVLGGVGLILKGVFTQWDAANDRAGAVDRYNTVVQSGKNLSMMVLPNTRTVGLGFTQTF